jgi:hypothetical protein
MDIINRQYVTSIDPTPFTSEVQEYKTASLVTVGKGKNAHKIKQNVKRHVTYTVIDVSVPSTTKQDIASDATQKHENWLTLHDSEDIIYELRDIAATTRNLDPNRNSRWKYARVVEVKKHQKYIPMLATPDKPMRIKKIVASQYKDTQEG